MSFAILHIIYPMKPKIQFLISFADETHYEEKQWNMIIPDKNVDCHVMYWICIYELYIYIYIYICIKSCCNVINVTTHIWIISLQNCILVVGTMIADYAKLDMKCGYFTA